MAEAFGAAVTQANGGTGSVGTGARTPHPARSNPARNLRWINFLIRYCDGGWGLGGVFVAVGIGVEVAVGGSVAVLIAVMVMGVGTVGIDVSVGKSGMIVTPGTGVRVEILGTQSLCPA